VPHFEHSNLRVSNSFDDPGASPAKAMRTPHLGQRGRSNASIIEGGGFVMAETIDVELRNFISAQTRWQESSASFRHPIGAPAEAAHQPLTLSGTIFLK
jgi:hypothetical protein